MRLLFLCPACERLTGFSEFRVEGDVLLLRCARCRVESRSRSAEAAPSAVAAAASTSRASPLLTPLAPRPLASEQMLCVPEGHCPKCAGIRPPQAASCAHCGLVFENFKPEELEPSPALAEHFRRLLSNWEDVEEHDRVMQAALLQGELPLLGRLYRIRLTRAPDDAYAARGRDEVLRLATASSAGLARGEPTDTSRHRTAGLLAAVVGMLLFMAVALFVIFRRYGSS